MIGEMKSYLTGHVVEKLNFKQRQVYRTVVQNFHYG